MLTIAAFELIAVGQTVILSCDSGFDSNYPTMRWTREETQIPDAHSSNHITVLKVAIELTESDEDVTYTCILGNGSVASSPSCSVIPLRYQLRVNINPKLTIKNVGENVTFNCSVSFERNKPGLSHLIYDWNDTILAKFSGRFVLDNENRSLQLLDLKYSDDLTKLQCRVTIRRTGAQDKAVALLRVNKTERSTTTPPLETYTSTQNYSTPFNYTHSTPVTLYTPPSELAATATLGNAFYIYLGISLIIVFVGVIILSVYTLHKTRINSRSRIKTRVLSVEYEEIKPKTAIRSKSNGQIVCGIVGPVEGKRSSQYEEVSDYELNNVTFCGTDMINSEKCGRNLGVQKEDTAANRTEGRDELIKSDSLYAQVDETKFTEISQTLSYSSDPNSSSARGGEKTRDTAPVYATVNKT
ncbi:hypothetical protein HOLleu_07987 [Holothuria leucospilota]|uniref:Ig-like domain-containing protein n=1 Tax=Holothuria leucospilota TaxID=206669 RepID=A0A9Q1HHE4_HOLLE|nr:hypothetical protein HOLleu_07987 [Holothuria leucospilota]